MPLDTANVHALSSGEMEIDVAKSPRGPLDPRGSCRGQATSGPVSTEMACAITVSLGGKSSRREAHLSRSLCVDQTHERRHCCPTGCSPHPARLQRQPSTTP